MKLTARVNRLEQQNGRDANETFEIAGMTLSLNELKDVLLRAGRFSRRIGESVQDYQNRISSGGNHEH